MQLQIDALRIALGKKGFLKQLHQKLANVRLAGGQADRELMRGYQERVGSLEQAESDNEKAAGAQGFANLANRSRERANALGEAMSSGAGESDILRAQQMSLRSWNANQNEVSRAFFDTQSSINSSLGDLLADTRSARVNNSAMANADREQLWTNYYNQRSETLTQLGNAQGQQAEYYGLANEAVSSKKTRRKQHAASHASGHSFTRASHVAGQAWESPGVRPALTNWQGAADFEGRMNNAQFAGAATELAPARPEGATLRTWST